MEERERACGFSESHGPHTDFVIVQRDMLQLNCGRALQHYQPYNAADYEPARLYSIYKVHTELRAGLWGTYIRKRAV